MSGGLRLGIFNDSIFEAYVVVCMNRVYMYVHYIWKLLSQLYQLRYEL